MSTQPTPTDLDGVRQPHAEHELPQHLAAPELNVIGTATALSNEETTELERCEAIIDRGLKTFFEVGAALMRVRDLRLYRAAYGTFDDYCQNRWGFGASRARQFIGATEIRGNLEKGVTTVTLPTTEAQTRPLARVKDPDQQREAWQRAVQMAEERGTPVTAALVEQVVREVHANDPSTCHTSRHSPPAPPAGDDQAADEDDTTTPQKEAPHDAAPAPGFFRLHVDAGSHEDAMLIQEWGLQQWGIMLAVSHHPARPADAGPFMVTSTEDIAIEQISMRPQPEDDDDDAANVGPEDDDDDDDDFEPDPNLALPSGTSGNAPTMKPDGSADGAARGSTPPDGYGFVDQDTYIQLQRSIEELQTLLDDMGAVVFSDDQAEWITRRWRQLTDRLTAMGVVVGE